MIYTQDFFHMAQPTFARLAERADFRPRSYLEIGTFEGQSLNYVLARWPQIDRADVVEDWSYGGEEQRLRWLANTAWAGLVVELGWPTEPVDLAFVDGDHSYAGQLEQNERAWELLGPGGFMVVDDYDLKPPSKPHQWGYGWDVRGACLEFLRRHNGRVEVISSTWALCLKKPE